jgi:hypothetical protein
MSYSRTFLFGPWVLGHMMGDRERDPISRTPARLPPDVMSRSKTSAGGGELKTAKPTADFRDITEQRWRRRTRLEMLEWIDSANKTHDEGRALLVGYAKVVFNRLAPNGFDQEEERKRFNRKLNVRMGILAEDFWLSAFKNYLLFLDTDAVEARRSTEESIKSIIEEYVFQKEQFAKATKILRKLQKNGFLCSVGNLEVREDPKKLGVLTFRTSPINLFIFGLVGDLKGNVRPQQIYKVIQEFLACYLGHEIDLSMVRKAYERNPFKKMVAKIHGSNHSD